MALQLQFETANGVIHPEAYLRILRIENDYVAGMGRCFYWIYHNKDARDSEKQAIWNDNTPVPVDGNRADAYNAIKLAAGGDNSTFTDV